MRRRINECGASGALSSVLCTDGGKFRAIVVSKRRYALLLGSGAKSAGISHNARCVAGRSFYIHAVKPLVSGSAGGGVTS